MKPGFVIKLYICVNDNNEICEDLIIFLMLCSVSFFPRVVQKLR